MPQVSLAIPPQPELVRTARLVAGAAARRCGVDEAILDEVRLAVGEACARAVLRHTESGVGADVRLELRDDDSIFAVDVHDSAAASQDSDEDELALAVITALAADSSVEQVDSGTVVHMSWPTGTP